MKRYDTVVLSTGMAHLLAWAGLLFLALWPAFYQGESVNPVAAYESPAPKATSFSLPLIEVNGLRVIPLLLVPVAVTAIGLLVALASGARRRRARELLWGLSVLLLLFCLVGLASIGMFYLPAALSLLFSAIIASRRSPPEIRRSRL